MCETSYRILNSSNSDTPDVISGFQCIDINNNPLYSAWPFYSISPLCIDYLYRSFLRCHSCSSTEQLTGLSYSPMMLLSSDAYPETVSGEEWSDVSTISVSSSDVISTAF